MGLVLFLLFLQTAACAIGFAYLWRRQQRMAGRIAQLQQTLAALTSRAAPQQRARVAEAGAVVTLDTGVDAAPRAEAPLARAARMWRMHASAVERAAPTLSPETGRGLVLGLMAILPAAGFLTGAAAPGVIAAGLSIAAAMMVIALRPMWRAAAWAGVLTASAWALLGFVLGAAHADPASYSVCVALAAAAGLTHAHLRRATPGATMALIMSAAVLALGSQVGMVGPAGIAFGAIVATAAIIGAMSLRLESMHLASFGAALIGLFVLSGQESAAIWFTPAVAWGGALYFAIAVIRVPQLGARGVALAGTGALAPFAAIAALYGAQHGLADRFAAAGAFAALAALLSGVVALSALRRGRGLAPLRVTLWVQALGAFAALTGAIALALPAPLAAPAFAALGLGLCALDLRLEHAVWRVFAWVAGALSAAFVLVSAQLLLAEAPHWAPLALISAGLAAPALILGAASYVARRSGAPTTAAFFEALAIVFAVAAASLVVRLAFSGGATVLNPVSFAEAGAHSATWLAVALLIGARANRGALQVRAAAMNTLTFGALTITTLACALWLTSFWDARPSTLASARETFGFLLPGVLLCAHWLFWRHRDDALQTRLTIGAGAFLLATFLTVEAVRSPNAPDWAGALIGALAFALAIGVNFAPGVTKAEAPPLPVLRSNLEKDLQRHRRRKKRVQSW